MLGPRLLISRAHFTVLSTPADAESMPPPLPTYHKRIVTQPFIPGAFPSSSSASTVPPSLYSKQNLNHRPKVEHGSFLRAPQSLAGLPIPDGNGSRSLGGSPVPPTPSTSVSNLPIQSTRSLTDLEVLEWSDESGGGATPSAVPTPTPDGEGERRKRIVQVGPIGALKGGMRHKQRQHIHAKKVCPGPIFIGHILNVSLLLHSMLSPFGSRCSRTSMRSVDCKITLKISMSSKVSSARTRSYTSKFNVPRLVGISRTDRKTSRSVHHHPKLAKVKYLMILHRRERYRGPDACLCPHSTHRYSKICVLRSTSECSLIC